MASLCPCRLLVKATVHQLAPCQLQLFRVYPRYTFRYSYWSGGYWLQASVLDLLFHRGLHCGQRHRNLFVLSRLFLQARSLSRSSDAVGHHTFEYLHRLDITLTNSSFSSYRPFFLAAKPFRKMCVNEANTVFLLQSPHVHIRQQPVEPLAVGAVGTCKPIIDIRSFGVIERHTRINLQCIHFRDRVEGKAHDFYFIPCNIAPEIWTTL